MLRFVSRLLNEYHIVYVIITAECSTLVASLLSHAVQYNFDHAYIGVL